MWIQAGNLAMFHQQLAYCTTQFVEKDPQTAETIILGLLKFWPQTASAKEVSTAESTALPNDPMLTNCCYCRSCF